MAHLTYQAIQSARLSHRPAASLSTAGPCTVRIFMRLNICCWRKILCTQIDIGRFLYSGPSLLRSRRSGRHLFHPPSHVVRHRYPLSFIFNKISSILYSVKYWSRLHRLSSHSQGLVCLSITFERLLQQLEPELWIHCLNNGIEPYI